MQRRGRKYDYKSHAKRMMKKLPPLPKGWRCYVIPYGHDDSEAPAFDGIFLIKLGLWGIVIPDKKIMYIYPGEDGVFVLRDKWGRTFGFEEGFSLIYCHEWYHIITNFADNKHNKCESFAYTWCKTEGIIF